MANNVRPTSQVRALNPQGISSREDFEITNFAGGIAYWRQSFLFLWRARPRGCDAGRGQINCEHCSPFVLPNRKFQVEIWKGITCCNTIFGKLSSTAIRACQCVYNHAVKSINTGGGESIAE